MYREECKSDTTASQGVSLKTEVSETSTSGSESGQTRFESVKTIDIPETITAAPENGLSGNGALKPVCSHINGKRKNGEQKGNDKYTHGELLEKGQWLWISAFENRARSFSFRVNGQLPFYHDVPRPDLLDRQNREVLIPGKKPRFLRDNYDVRADARSFMNRLEQACEGIKIESHSVQTFLSESLIRQYEKLHLRLEPHWKKNYHAIEETGDLYERTYGNALKAISVQQLYALMVEKESLYLGQDWLDKIGVAVNAVCRGCGQPAQAYDHRGARKYDLALEDIAKDGLERFLRSLPYKRAKEILRPFSRFLQFAVKEHYLRRNVAKEVDLRQTKAERMAQAMTEIIIDDNEKVQIALNLAADYRVGARHAGYFVPHVVFLYYGAMRPWSELRNMNPLDVRLSQKLIRLFSTKKMQRRIKTLPANAVAMLSYYWDGQQLSFEGWNKFWKMVQAAQGYDVKCPGWFKVPDGRKIPPKPDVPRHTGCSHGINLLQNPWEAVREDGHGLDIFRAHYDGLVTREETAQFCVLFPANMPVSDKIRQDVRNDLIQYGLLKDGQTIPPAPQVPHFDVTPPPYQLWLPAIPDNQLRDKIRSSNLKTAATELGTNVPWLLAICRAKQIPLPKAGRRSQQQSESAPIPPPVTTMPHDQLAKLIQERHGVAPAAKELGIYPLYLSAYCAVHKIPVPSAHALALYYNNRFKVRTSRAQVRAMLEKASLEEMAASLNLTVEHLRDYCKRHRIRTDRAAELRITTPIFEDIKLAVIKELNAGPCRVLKNDEAMELVLSKAPDGLTQEELVRVVDQATGVKLTAAAIKYVVNESAKGRFQRHCGQIRLIGVYETKVDMDHLKSLLKAELGRRSQWSLIQALRCVLPKTPKGLSLDQLLEVLPVFGIGLDKPALKKELKRLDRQGRITFYYNQVTCSEGTPNWKLRVHDKEPTPGFAMIKQHVEQFFAELANRNLTNVEMMRFILGMAPDGLWRDELLEIANSCGIDFRPSCIHSVVQHEAKGEFKCENGRVRFVGAIKPRITISELRQALSTNTSSLPRKNLILEILNHFPQGLGVNDLKVAAELVGHKVSRDTFRRQIYKIAEQSQVEVKHGLVRRFDDHIRQIPSPNSQL
jgi:hypothetical protein